MSFDLLPNEIVHRFINHSEDNLLGCRGVNRTWKGYADELCVRKMKAFPIDIAPYEAPLLYLRLKSFVPRLFQMLAAQDLPLPECLPLIILNVGMQKSSCVPEDLLKLNDLRIEGQRLCNRPVRSEAVEQLKMTRTAVLLAQKIEALTLPKDSEIVKIVSAILLNKYTQLSYAIKLKNELSASFFLSRVAGLTVKSLQDDFINAQSTNFSLAKRIFEVLVVQDPLFTASGEFNHALGHMAAQVKWVKIFLLKAEEKRNSLWYKQTQEISVEETGVAHFETSALCLGENALHEAVCFNNTQRVVELLDCGYSVNQRDCASRTAVMLAARKGSAAAFTLLLARGAKILKKDMWGLTAIDWCAINGRHDMLIACHAYAHQTAEYHHALFLYKSRSIKYVAEADPFQQIIEGLADLQIF